MYTIWFCSLGLLWLPSFTPAAKAQNTELVQSGTEIQTQPVLSGTWTTGFYTRSFATGDGLVLADEPVVQSELKIAWQRSKFSGSFQVRGSKGFKANWMTFSDEVDLGTELNYAGPADLKVAFTHIALVPAANTDVQSIEFKISKSLSFDKHNTLTPSVRLDTFWPTGDNGPKSGTLLNGGVAYLHTFSQWIDISNEVHFMRDIDGPFGLRPRTNIYSYEGAVDLIVGHGWTFTPKIIYGGTFNDPDRRGKLTFTFEAARAFSFRKGS